MSCSGDTGRGNVNVTCQVGGLCVDWYKFKADEHSS